jgi:esterase/lipase superfamily enzyme
LAPSRKRLIPMHREYHRWHSPHLNRDMELLVFGHAGARVLAFPTSRARFHEWEDRGLIGTLGHHIEQGWLQVTCVDSIDTESWYAYHHHPGERVWRNELYDRYLLGEVLPLTRAKNPNPFLITVGASLGAYHAANFAFRHPEQVGRVLGLCGVYDIRRFLSGFYNETVYFHNPVDYIDGECDPGRLEALRRLDIILTAGQTDPLRHSSEELSHKLWQKNIWHALRIWDGFAHDWPYWHKMLPLYIGGHD